ncbi:MAG TPA: hypothetical protein VFX51_10350 [Solirubrobacteraceae bacterium]|nr:hypothetical protein [Solirubrobacteraceae bacterium]
MPVPPAELSAHYRIAGPPDAEEAARAVAAPSGIAHDGGPGETLLSGSRAQVLATLGDVVQAALDAHAHRIDVRLEAPTESRS